MKNIKFDLSFIPSYKCNLQCWFCMYSASPYNNSVLDIRQTKKFIKTIDWTNINSVGFYGREISINYSLYQKFINIIPDKMPKFTISNGTWSTNSNKTEEFIKFIKSNNLYVKVSNTCEHNKYQNKTVIKLLEEQGYLNIKKNDDTKGKLLSMGRLEHLPLTCTQKCKTYSIPVLEKNITYKLYRLAIEPSGDIMFQTCDGKYPIIGNYYNSFDEVINKLNNFSSVICLLQK